MNLLCILYCILFLVFVDYFKRKAKLLKKYSHQGFTKKHQLILKHDDAIIRSVKKLEKVEKSTSVVRDVVPDFKVFGNARVTFS